MCVGEVCLHIELRELLNRPPVCTERVSTEQLNNLMYMCENLSSLTSKSNGRRGSVRLSGTPLPLSPPGSLEDLQSPLRYMWCFTGRRRSVSHNLGRKSKDLPVVDRKVRITFPESTWKHSRRDAN